MSLQHPELDRDSRTAAFGALFLRHQQLELDRTTERIAYTKHGNPYISQTGDGHASALNEYAPTDVSVFCSDEELGKVYGPQITQYFNFLKFIIFTNFVFFLISLISFVPHALNTGDRLKSVNAGFLQTGTSTSELDLLFLASYQPSSDGSWSAMMALASLLSFATGPLYLLASTFIFKDYIGATERDIAAEDDVIPENKEETTGYTIRLILHYPLFIICCCIPGVIMYFVLFHIFYAVVQGSYDEGQKGSGAGFSEAAPLLLSLVPSAIVAVANILFGMVVDKLNMWDKHPSWSTFRNHRMFKILLFRIFNVMCLFSFKYYSDMPFYTCLTQRIAFQVFTFILMDITVNNFIEIFLPGILSAVGSCFAKDAVAEGSDDDQKPDFELSEEYFEIIYRQFIMYMGISVFPMISVITLLTNILELFVDRYRLIRVCAKPKGMVPGGRRRLFVQLMFAALCGLVAFPCGAIWFASGFLCWPCPQYSGSTTFTASSRVDSKVLEQCGNVKAFEAPDCKLTDGTDVSVAEIRLHVDRMKGWDTFSKQELQDAFPRDWQAKYEESQEFLSTNYQTLASSRRCACSPCVNVKSCNCGDRALEQACRLESNRHCVRPGTGEVQRQAVLDDTTQDPAAQDQYCRDSSTCMAPFSECVENRNYRIYQCTTTISEYSASASGTGQCESTNAQTNTPCSSHTDCGAEGACVGGKKFQCPTPLSTDDSVSNAPNCWNCPETRLGGLINPSDAKKWWKMLDQSEIQPSANLCRSCFSPFGATTCNRLPDVSLQLFGKEAKA